MRGVGSGNFHFKKAFFFRICCFNFFFYFVYNSLKIIKDVLFDWDLVLRLALGAARAVVALHG